jgi:hypothetical protein
MTFAILESLIGIRLVTLRKIEFDVIDDQLDSL